MDYNELLEQKNELEREYNHIWAMYQKFADEFAKSPNKHTEELMHKYEQPVTEVLFELEKVKYALGELE